MAGRISVTEFMETEEAALMDDAASRARAKENGGAFEGYGPDGVYFLIDDYRVMLLSTRRFMTQ